MAKTLAQYQAQLNHLIETGQKGPAKDLLVKLAVACARKKNFSHAEAFRDQLYDMDSLELDAIIKVNEIIEAEKGSALSPKRRKLWSRFFEIFDTETANTFFTTLQCVSLEAEQVILQQGEPNDRLYLVEEGQLKILHENEGRQILIHTIGPGDIFGEDTFFSINVCAISVVTLSNVTLSSIDRAHLAELKKQFTSVDEDLKEVCGAGERIAGWLRQKKLDRRMFERYKLNAKVFFQVMSEDDNTSSQQEYNGDLWDISKKGLCITFKTKDRTVAQQMIGRTISVYFKPGENLKELALRGMVRGVKNHPMDEYSLHVKLKDRFSDKSMKIIRRYAGT